MMYFVITFKNNGYGSQKTVMRQTRHESNVFRNTVEVLTSEGFKAVDTLPDFDCQPLSVPTMTQLSALGVRFA